MKKMLTLLLTLTILGCKESSPGAKTAHTAQPDLQWEVLFDGQSLEGWTPKITGQPAGMDSLNTFKAEDGMIRVTYDNYETFGNRFGHLFYKEAYAAYYLSLEYRFLGDQAPDGEGWAFKNSGVMFHSQSASSMLPDQNFPVSLEGQFLGGNGTDPRPTMNLCTPGTNVVMADSLFTPHCVNSTSPTFHDEQWVRAGFLVLADSLIVHYVNGKEVLRYSKPQLGGTMAEDAAEAFRHEGKPLKEGYIALQSESHPIDFRNIRILDLQPLTRNRKVLERITDSLITQMKLVQDR
ncbi:3-keto-disaccharide hydrolase [Robertkochia sediminum]|uniref:3-keto-disaccharide hydrolase n=1 Tax=Robertkochia sediminum TaxID=2785326 RepID=UPI001932BD88|nr:DUF1080 domain-containing protein [Robertkochia sediminum]MBL7471907.1 DUF1080 domain-containing protein [Robertkochia sediminum]